MFSSSSGGTVFTASPPQLYLSTMPEYSAAPQQQQTGTDGAAGAHAHALGDPKRRSTGASDALQYYWSSSAGERASSTGSSFGMSPIDSSPRPNILSSPYSLSPHPILHEERSHRSLRELVQEEEEEDRRRIAGGGDGNLTIRGKQLQPTTNPNVAGTAWDPRFADAAEGGEGRDRRERTKGMERTRLLIPEGDNGPSDAGPSSNRHIHLISYSSDGSMSALASGPSVPNSLNKMSPGTPGSPSHSSDSEYSFLEDDPVAPPRREEQRASTIARNQQHRHGVVDADGELHVLLDPTFEEWAHQRIWGQGDPDSSAPTSTDVHSSDHSSRYNSVPNSQPTSQPTSRPSSRPHSNPVSPPLQPPQSNNEPWRTPTQPPTLDHASISPIDWPTRTPSPGQVLNNRASSSTAQDRTPRNSQAQTPRASFRPSPPAGESPNSRRLFVASSADMPRRSLDNLQNDNPGLGLGGPLTARGQPAPPIPPGTPGRLEELDHPRSAPPTKTSFTDIDVVPDTRAARATSLQAPAPIAAQTKSQKLLSPEEATPLATARRSPEPPPRSERRKLTPNSDTAVPLVSEPEEMSPISPVASLGTPLPTIINTASTPVASPQAPGRGSAARSHAATSPVPAPMQRYGSNSPKPKPKTAPGTIQDLTDMLGGAIDDIGLVDSRSTPPPNIPLKETAMLASLPARSTSSNQSRSASHGSSTTVTSKSIEESAVSPTMSTFSAASTTFSASPSAPSRPAPLAPAATASAVGLGLMGGVSGGPQQRPRHVRKASSILSLRSSNHSFSPTVPTFAASTQQLPAAVLFGNIKALRTAGERARAYASSLEALAEADSGLRAWYTAALSGARPQRPIVLGGGGKASTMSHLGLSEVAGSMFNLNLHEPTPRNVSTGSEFPMRPDAYAAREISVRNLDPSDGPTALPPNLPYPQLQSQLGGNVRPSTSLQSIASVSTTATTTKRSGGGFFSGIGRALKKDKDPGLGPPTGQLGTLTSLNPAASSSKRDLRSNKGYTPPPPGGRASLDSLGDNSLPAPIPRALGPRGPRDGIPTSRVSMDVPRPMGAQAMPRGSLDGGGPRMRMGGGGGGLGFGAGVPGGPRTLSPLARGDSVSDADVQQLCDYIPHADRGVARVYVQRYKGLAEAVTAYIEDDKNGVLMKAA